MPALNCLYTVVKSNLAVPWTFSYLNVTLNPYEELFIFGDLMSAVAARGAERATAAKYLKALRKDLEENRLLILETPSQVLYDDILGESKIITLTGGNAQLDPPCWP